MKESDPCGYCGCMRKYHSPDKAYTSSKFRIGQTSGTMILITARTCCDKCPHCICSCVAFIEPFKGQKRLHCAHATENNIDHDYHVEWDSFFNYSISRHVPQVRSKVPKHRGVETVPSVREAVHPKKGTGKKLRNTVKPKSSKSGGLF